MRLDKAALFKLIQSKKAQVGSVATSAVKSIIGLVIFLAVIVALVPLALTFIGNLSSLDIVLVSAIVAILPILIGVFILTRGMDFFKLGR